jgi:SpoVK/Ycf46/Vps4 family AAA+-type ATPase
MELKLRLQNAESCLANLNFSGALDELTAIKNEGIRIGLATKDPHMWLRTYVLLAIVALKRGPFSTFESYHNIASVVHKKLRFVSHVDTAALLLLDCRVLLNGTDLYQPKVTDKLHNPIFKKELPEWTIPLLLDLIDFVRDKHHQSALLRKILVNAMKNRPIKELKNELTKLIQSMVESGNRNDTDVYLIQMLEILYDEVPRPIVEIAQTHRKLAWILLARNSTTKAVLQMEKALRIIDSVGMNNNLKAAILSDKAVMESNRGVPDKDCLEIVNEAIKLASSTQITKDSVLLARLWNVHADFLVRLGKKSEADESRKKSMMCLSSSNDSASKKSNENTSPNNTVQSTILTKPVERLTAEDFASNNKYYESNKSKPSTKESNEGSSKPPKKEIEVIPNTNLSHSNQNQQYTYSAEAVESALSAINRMTGLKEAKLAIKKLADFHRFQHIRAQAGHVINPSPKPHMFFLGNPGTGKTTLARMMGQLFYALGITKSAEVIEVSRADLVGQYIGQTAQMTAGIIRKAQGKTLFIDEAYTLAKDVRSWDFGKEAIDTLIQAMTDPSDDMIVIAAGYSKNMSQLISANPGLASRITHHINLDDFIPDELMEISDSLIEQRGMIITPSARQLFNKKITDLYRSRDETFGNARLVGTLISKVEQALSSRLIENSTSFDSDYDLLLEIMDTDVEKVFSVTEANIPNFSVDEELLSDQLSELEQLIGLENVKEELQEIISLVRYFKEEGKNPLEAFSLNLGFIGAPGTGKTTVARIFSQILKTLGVIERGHLVECDRSSLVTGRGDGTAAKVTEVFDSAMGGTLFIDEVYALVNGNNDAFGYEAVNTLVKLVEDNRGKLCVIIAGYEKETEDFLKVNPGLKSRFDKLITFPSYTCEQLNEIALNTLSKLQLSMDDLAYQELISAIKSMSLSSPESFGNARGVRKIMETIIRKQQVRLSKIPHAERTDDEKRFIILDDVKAALLKEIDLKVAKKRVGF